MTPSPTPKRCPRCGKETDMPFHTCSKLNTETIMKSAKELDKIYQERTALMMADKDTDWTEDKFEKLRLQHIEEIQLDARESALREILRICPETQMETNDWNNGFNDALEKYEQLIISKIPVNQPQKPK